MNVEKNLKIGRISSSPKLGGEPSEARREVPLWNHPVFAHFVREATPPNLGGELIRPISKFLK